AERGRMGEPNAALNVYMSKKERIRDVCEYYMGEKMPPGYEIEAENGFYSLEDGKKLTYRERDQFKKVKDAGGIKFFLGIENQMTVNLTFPQRLLEMDSLEYKRQTEEIREKNKKAKVKYKKADDFKYGFRKTDRLKPVCNIKLYWGKGNPEMPASLKDIMDMEEVPEAVRNLFNDYRVHTVRMLQIPDEALDKMESDIKYVVGVLKRTGRKGEYRKFICENEAYFRRIPLDAYNVINVCADTGKMEKYLEQKEEYEEESVNMCQALDELIEDGEKNGIRIGRQEAVFELLEEHGELPEEVKNRINREENIEILKIWLKLAAKVKSIEEFCLAMG
ncbi:MAG: hypothetical protein NC086_07830, partial [Alistipes sp.]|nr:hypothetical protein [Alistipes sp.]